MALSESLKPNSSLTSPTPPKIDQLDIEDALLRSMKDLNKPKTENQKEEDQDDMNSDIEELSEVLEEQFKQEEEKRLKEEEKIQKEEKRQNEERRLHLRQQDDAYETSVAMDRSKEEYRKELERIQKKQLEEQKRLEELKENQKKERERYLKTIEQNLPQEPDTTDPNALQITFRLPNGDRFSRFFLKTSLLKQVKDFVDTQELYGKLIPSSYNLITDFPKQIWNKLDLPLSQTNFQKRQLLRIEPDN